LTAMRADAVGMVFQRFHLLDHLSVGQNVELPGFFSAQAMANSEELLEAVGLAGRAQESPATMSGGERQRVAIARALHNRPKVLLADEPTGNLDEASGAVVIEHLRRLAKEQGAASLWVTHEERVAEAADRCLTLVNGKLEEGT